MSQKVKSVCDLNPLPDLAGISSRALHHLLN